VLGIGIITHFYKYQTHRGLYRQIERQLLVFQTAAVMEVSSNLYMYVLCLIVCVMKMAFTKQM